MITISTNQSASKLPTIENIKLGSFLYYLAFALFVGTSMFVQTAFDALGVPTVSLQTAARVFVLLALCVKVASERFSSREFLSFVVLVFCAVMMRFLSKDATLSWLFLFVACGKNINVSSLAKITLGVVGVLLIITMVSAYLDIIPSYDLSAEGARTERSSMGFLHPNRLGEYLFVVFMSLAVLGHTGKRKVLTIAVAFLCIGIAYYVCNSRTSCITILLVATGVLLYPLISRFSKSFLVLAIVLCGIVIAASFWCMFFYDSADALFASLNKLFSGRLSLAHRGFEAYGITLFGQECTGGPILGYSLVTNEPYYFWVDMAYPHSLIKFGLIPTVVYLVLVFLVLINAFRRSCFGFIEVSMVVLILIGFSEVYPLSLECNYFIVATANVLFSTAADKRVERKGANIELLSDNCSKQESQELFFESHD